jgi:hypothetical protein
MSNTDRSSEFVNTPLEPFSGGYYGARFEVQKYNDGPVIEQSLYDYVVSNLYQQTDSPPWAQVGMNKSPYFQLGGEPGVPGSVLGLPEKFIKEYDILDNGHTHYVMLVKPKYSYMLSVNKNLENQLEDVDRTI